MAWYDEVFKGTYDRFTFNRFTPAADEMEAEFIQTALQLGRGYEVLDIACGYGRHAVHLAQRGIRITGIDSTERYVEMASRAAEKLPAEFLVGDMRELNYEERFDAAYCFFTSFGYFDDDTNFDILKRVATALKPGGRFLLDTRNREAHVDGELEHQDFLEFEEDGAKCVIVSYSTFDLETSHAHGDHRLYRGGAEEPEEMKFSVRLYTLAELRWLMHRAGMEVIKTFGNADASPYTIDSPRMILIAQKI